MKYLEFISGVYCIYTAENDPLFIGAAVDIRKRFLSEKKMLEKNIHPNTDLQAYYNQDQELRFVPIFYCHESKLRLNKFNLINIIRPEFNTPAIKSTLDGGDLPHIVKLLAQEFAGREVLMAEIQGFLNDHGEIINKVQLGRMLSTYNIAEVIRNWSERGKQYYRFR